MALITGLIATPVVAFIVDPLWHRRGAGGAGDDYADAGALDSIPAGAWTLRPIEITRQDGWDKRQQARSVWVMVNGNSATDIKVLSPICPHLGCPIALLTATQFRCPCHGGTFNNDGELIAGPPPRGMDPLQFQVRDGHLWVLWQDFQIGVHERIPVAV
jgi:Rieske Fe-S protein